MRVMRAGLSAAKVAFNAAHRSRPCATSGLLRRRFHANWVIAWQKLCILDRVGGIGRGQQALPKKVGLDHPPPSQKMVLVSIEEWDCLAPALRSAAILYSAHDCSNAKAERKEKQGKTTT